MTETSSLEAGGGRAHLLWHACGVVLVVLVPTLARLGLPFWEIPQRLLPQVPALAVGYLATALALAVLPGTGAWARGFRALLYGGLAFGLALFLLVYLPGFDYSRLIILTGIVLGLPVAILPYFIPAALRRTALVFLVPVTAVVAGWSAWTTSRLPHLAIVESRHRTSELTGTALHNLKIDRHTGLLDYSLPSGGGIVAYRGDFIAANGVGQIHRLRAQGNGFESEPLGVPRPLDWDAFVADNAAAIEGGHFRVMDLLVDSTSAPHRLLASHYFWDRDARCVAMRISTIPIPEKATGEGAPTNEWEPVFTTRPCVPVAQATTTEGLTNRSGGRMAWASDGSLLYSVGDFFHDGLNGLPSFAQKLDNDYGKVLRIHPLGDVETVSVGHRNPEGLLVTRDGTIWETEHGPAGGDELNLVLPGANYGWPLVTYGTEPGVLSWGLSDLSRNHGPYEEPRYSWVPAVGISNLIELGGEQFPGWEGDLLAASLNGQSLFRIRIREGRVIYMERIVIGGRLRDLLEDPEGRILVWTDESVLVTIANGGNDRTGEILFAQCASCHASAWRAEAIGPELRGVFGRWAGTVPGYDYSRAFEGIELRWSPETLDRFLENPSAMVPGTRMQVPGLPPSDREAVIEFLRRYE
ncbi:MAG: PQQ-dependent sugar dehydrogenase [Gemmatimonadota bacterium]